MLVNLAPGLFGIISLPLKNYLFLCRQKPGSKQEGTNFSIIHLLLSAILYNDAYSIIINITLILFSGTQILHTMTVINVTTYIVVEKVSDEKILTL